MAKQNFSVARIETRTRATVGKFERHIERKNDSYENMNVDLSRTPMNVKLDKINVVNVRFFSKLTFEYEIAAIVSEITLYPQTT